MSGRRCPTCHAVTHLMRLTFSTVEDRDIGFGVNISRFCWYSHLGRSEFSICLQSSNLIIHLCIYKRSKNQIPVLNGPFHSTLIRSYATRQPAMFTRSVFEQAPVINRSSVVQMEANNNRPGHSVQQRHQFTVSAPRAHSCLHESHYLYSYSPAAGGAVKKKKKVKRPPSKKRADFHSLSSLHGISCEADARPRRRSTVYGLLIVSEGVAVRAWPAVNGHIKHPHVHNIWGLQINHKVKYTFNI